MPDLGKHYEDFEVGDTYVSPWRTLTDSHMRRFLDLSGLHEPLFNDRQHALEELGHDDWMLPGFLTVSTLIGLFNQSGWFDKTAIAILDCSISWENPAYVDDEIRVEVEIMDKRPSDSDRGGIVELEWRAETRDHQIILMESRNFVKKRPDAS